MKRTSTIPSPLNSSRRTFLVAGASTAALASLGALPAHASVQRAEQLIQALIGDVMRIVNSGKSSARVLKDFEEIFTSYADVPRISQSILGPPWRSASNAEKQAFMKSLRAYLARKYGKRFDEAKGTKIDIVSSQDFGRKGVLVKTMISTDVWEPYPVEWQVIEAGSQPKFFNLIVEGVKLLSTEKSQIRALYDRNGGSIAKLNAALDRS